MTQNLLFLLEVGSKERDKRREKGTARHTRTHFQGQFPHIN